MVLATYIGCFVDRHVPRTLPYGEMINYGLTVAMCVQHCLNLGKYAYAGKLGLLAQPLNGWSTIGIPIGSWRLSIDMLATVEWL